MNKNIELEDIIYSILSKRIEKYGSEFDLNKVKQASWYFITKHLSNFNKQSIQSKINALLEKYKNLGITPFKHRRLIDLQEPKSDKFSIRSNSILRYAVCPNSSPTMLNLKGLCLHKALLQNNPNIKVYFRFDDSSPDNKPPTKSAYKGYLKALKWLNLNVDIIYVSDRIERYYTVANLLLNAKKAYILYNKITYYDLETWNKFIAGKLFNAVFYVADIQPWVGLRMCKSAHIRQPKYRIWPTLNFHSPIDDIDYGITAIYRGKDLLATQKKQKIIYDFLKPENNIQFTYWGRNRLPTYSVHSSTLIKNKNLYDPKTIFLQNLIYYEIRPNALYKFYKEMGFSNTDTILNIGILKKFQKLEVPPNCIKYSTVETEPMFVHFYQQHITGDKGFILVNRDFRKYRIHTVLKIGKEYFKINPQKKLIKLIF